MGGVIAGDLGVRRFKEVQRLSWTCDESREKEVEKNANADGGLILQPVESRVVPLSSGSQLNEMVWRGPGDAGSGSQGSRRWQ